jgi:acyl-CoA synthetase (NDP forming)
VTADVAERVDNSSLLSRALLSPRSVAIVGASADPSKTSSRPQRYLRKHGFEGTIHLVNPGRSEILGEKVYPDIRSIGAPVDQAFIMVQADLVPGVVEQCGAAGIPCATILSDGFSESGATGRDKQRQLVDRARAAGVRLLGPNSIGIINAQDRIALSVSATLTGETLLPGRLSVISQSGSAIGMLLSRAQSRGIGFSVLVSVGNESDIGVGEIGEMVVDREDTDAVLLFLETVRDGAAFARMARHAYARGKPVVAFVLGKSAVGQEISALHTGALATDYASIDAFLRDHGVLRIEMLETLFEIPDLVKGRTPPTGRAVSIVTTTGGGGAMVADRLAGAGVNVVPPADSVIARLAKRGIAIKKAPLVDLTLAGVRQDVYGSVLGELVEAGEADLVVAVVGASAQFHPEHAVAPVLRHRSSRVPVAAFLTPEAPQSLHHLAGGGIAAFRTPETCADAVLAFFNWRPPRPEADAALAAEIQARIGPLSLTGALNEVESRDLLGKLGVTSVASRVVVNLDELEELDDGVTFPVALKILSRDVPHKTDAGGVALNISNALELRKASREMLARVRAACPSARIEGLLVQPMVRGVGEALVGFRRSASLGPIVTVAAGGVLTEIHRDFACATAPVDLTGAREMIERVRSFELIRGYRRQKRGDCEALAHVVRAMSLLALVPSVTEAEINPVMVMEEGRGVVAVDGLVVAYPAQSSSGGSETDG